MLAFFLLVVAVVLLMILINIAYRSDGVEVEAPPEPDNRLDKLVMILDTDVMEDIIQRARAEECSEAEVLNRLLRERLRKNSQEGLESPPHL